SRPDARYKTPDGRCDGRSGCRGTVAGWFRGRCGGSRRCCLPARESRWSGTPVWPAPGWLDETPPSAGRPWGPDAGLGYRTAAAGAAGAAGVLHQESARRTTDTGPHPHTAGAPAPAATPEMRPLAGAG